jgi:hypothetical protein
VTLLSALRGKVMTPERAITIKIKDLFIKVICF